MMWDDEAPIGPLEKLASKWERVGHEHGIRQFTGNDHLLFANELRVAMAKAEAMEGPRYTITDKGRAMLGRSK